MAEYTVIKAFRDVSHNVTYQPGDIYPRHDKAATAARIAVLLGNGNAQGVPLIEEKVTAIEYPAAVQEQTTNKRGRKPKKQVTEDVD